MIDIFSPNFWWMIAGMLLIIEIITPSTIFIFPAFSGVIVAVLSYFIPSPILLTIIFFVLSIVLIIYARPLFSTGSNQKNFRFGSDALIGMKLRVVETINNQKDMGKVKHAGDIFPARSIDNYIIQEGSLVTVIQIDGIKCLVKRGIDE